MSAGSALYSYARAFSEEMVPVTLFSDRIVLFFARLLVMLALDYAWASRSTCVTLLAPAELLEAAPSTTWGRACRSVLLECPFDLILRAHQAAESSFLIFASNVNIAPFGQAIV